MTLVTTRSSRIDRTRRFRFGRRSRRGGTVVEFALTLPIFLLFLMAAFEFGWMNVVRHTADNAAYEAARAAIVPGATSAEVTAKANAVLKVFGVRGATVALNPSTITDATKQVTVSVDVPMKSNALVIPKFTSKTTLHSAATLRTERAE